jgi:SAM-dependent methyltransferase
MAKSDEHDEESVRETVRAGYGKIARGERDAASSQGATSGANARAATPATSATPEKTTCCGPASSCSSAPADLATKVGYSQRDVDALPEGTNMGLSCGNPTALASLAPGEIVLDLGSGGGMDAFIAGPKVGPRGRVIGVDMTPDMLSKARRNTAEYKKRSGLDNVEFRLGEIEHLPVADASVDVVISNCVLNLSPDKPQVWREIARVLKPGGRVAVSDLALIRPLPREVVSMVEALVGCVAGAVLVDETEHMARAAGLEDVRLERKDEYMRAMTSFEDPLYAKISRSLPAGKTPSDYVTSLNVTARKPLAGART